MESATPRLKICSDVAETEEPVSDRYRPGGSLAPALSAGPELLLDRSPREQEVWLRLWVPVP